MQLKIEDLLTGPNKSDLEVDDEEKEMKEAIDELKTELLEIEQKTGDALKGAYVQFASQLQKHTSEIVDKTGVFLGDDCLEECKEFASKLKAHGLEQFEVQ